MSWLKRAIEIAILLVVLPLVGAFWVGIAIAVGIEAVLIYVGALLAAWIFGAIGLPMLFGVISPREIADGFRSRRRSERFYEGEPLPGRTLSLPRLRRARTPRKVLVEFQSLRRKSRRDESEPLPDWLLGFPFSKTFDAR